MTKQLEMKNKMELELRQEMNNLAQMNSNLKEENSFFKLTPLGTLKSKHEKELYAIHEKTKERNTIQRRLSQKFILKYFQKFLLSFF